MRRRRQMGDEILKGCHIRRHAFQNEVDLARKHPALAHQRLGPHELLEGAQVGFGLAGQMHGCEHGDVKAEPARIEKPAIALDVALFLERSHPAQTRRWGNPYPLGQFDVGNSAVGLDLAQNFEVDLVKILRHAGPGPWWTKPCWVAATLIAVCTLLRNFIARGEALAKQSRENSLRRIAILA